MKAKKKMLRKARRQKEFVQRNRDSGPNKRWATGGYRMPGSNQR